LSQEYSYQKLLKSDNPSSRYNRKCRGCFLGHSVLATRTVKGGVMTGGKNVRTPIYAR